jgi:VWFA-related protein
VKILVVVFACLVSFSLFAQYVVDVQVVDLQVSVTDQDHNFVDQVKPDDFQVWEDGQLQEILDVELKREPFSIGVVLDTSSSMQPYFRITTRGTEDFLWSLKAQDEFFLMTFDDQILLKKNFGFAAQRSSVDLKSLRYGDTTKMFEAILSAIHRLQDAHYPRRALFVISDGINTAGEGDLQDAIEEAQKNKVLVYTLLLDNEELDTNPLRRLSEATGGTYFILYENFPRLQSAYGRIANDLAHRFTLFYRSRSDYSAKKKPIIKVAMKNPKWKVQFQKAYFPQSKW